MCRDAEELKHEAMSHALSHTNIVQLYAMIFEQLHYGVVLEFVPFGPLNEFIHKYQVCAVKVGVFRSWWVNLSANFGLKGT